MNNDNIGWRYIVSFMVAICNRSRFHLTIDYQLASQLGIAACVQCIHKDVEPGHWSVDYPISVAVPIAGISYLK